MAIINWLIKIFSFGKKDLEYEKLRQEKLANVLRIIQRTSEKNWSFQKNVKVVKDTIYHEKHVGDDFIGDAIFGGFWMPRYEIDNTKEPIKIYETLPCFLSLDHKIGFVTFSSADDDVFCKGRIVGIVNSIIVEEIAIDRSDLDNELLKFFDDLRFNLKKKVQ